MNDISGKINWRYVAEGFAVLSVVTSLIFVGVELRLNRSIADADGIGQSMELSMNLAQLINDNPDIWARGCFGEALTPEEEVIFYNIASAANARFIYQYSRSNVGIGNPSSLENAPQTVALNMQQYPGLREALKDIYGYGESSERPISLWGRRVMDLYEELEELPLNTTVEIGLCGR